MLNLSEARTQLETKVCVYANPVKTIIKTRRTMKKSPLKFIRMCAWLDHDTDWSVDEENDRQSEEKKSVPRRRARRIKLNWDPDGDKGEDRENDAEEAHGPIITNGRRLFMK